MLRSLLVFCLFLLAFARMAQAVDAPLLHDFTLDNGLP